MPTFDAIQSGPNRPSNNISYTKPPKRRRKWKRWAVILILLAVGAFAGRYYLNQTNQIFTGSGNIFTRVGNLIISPDRPLVGETEGSVNVLLMGVGGAGHDGAYLTDTMMVAQINTITKEVTLISIPRDFGVTIEKYGYNKINAAYVYDYRNDSDSSGDVAIEEEEKIKGIVNPYYAVVDFKGFVEAVNNVGGLDIVVDNTYTDETFPH